MSFSTRSALKVLLLGREDTMIKGPKIKFIEPRRKAEPKHQDLYANWGTKKF